MDTTKKQRILKLMRDIARLQSEVYSLIQESDEKPQFAVPKPGSIDADGTVTNYTQEGDHE